MKHAPALTGRRPEPLGLDGGPGARAAVRTGPGNCGALGAGDGRSPLTLPGSLIDWPVLVGLGVPTQGHGPLPRPL